MFPYNLRQYKVIPEGEKSRIRYKCIKCDRLEEVEVLSEDWKFAVAGFLSEDLPKFLIRGECSLCQD